LIIRNYRPLLFGLFFLCCWFIFIFFIRYIHFFGVRKTHFDWMEESNLYRNRMITIRTVSKDSVIGMFWVGFVL
jgi:hypothetical protein